MTVSNKILRSGAFQSPKTGRWYQINDKGQATPYAQEEEGPTCSICDGLGHGYPGGGPCPLEERGYFDYDERG